jgi:hypothetical protein
VITWNEMIESIFTGMQEKQKEVIKLASKLYVEKLKLSKDIFGLAEELAKLDEIDKRGESTGHATRDHCGERGQECHLCSLGCRSKVYLSGDAALGYCTGYRLIRLSGRAYNLSLTVL